jgi:pimeloyl-ACP methyl ester carboxylesterase
MRESYVLGFSQTAFHRIAYTEWGDGNNPRVLICAHGLSRNGRDFDALAEAMSRDYRVLCPDFVGRGKSDWLQNKAGYGYPQYLSDMTVLIARTGAEQVDWVGTSMGGLTGMFIAAQPKSPIRKMVINDVGSHIPMAALERIGTYVGTNPVFDSYEAYKEHLKIIAAPFGLKTEAQWDHIARSSVRIAADGKAHSNCDPGIGDSFRTTAVADIDLSAFWNAVRCPVLVTRGALSDLLLPETYSTMLHKPGVSGVEIPGVGHAPMFLDDEQISIVREFLLKD